MSTDTFEDQLRSLLHDTADAEGPAYVDVDPNAVVTTGRAWDPQIVIHGSMKTPVTQAA